MRQSFGGTEGVGVAEWSVSSRCASLWASIESGATRGQWIWLRWLSPGGASIWGFSSTSLFICFHGVSSPLLVVQHYLISFDSVSQKLLMKVFLFSFSRGSSPLHRVFYYKMLETDGLCSVSPLEAVMCFQASYGGNHMRPSCV